MGWGRKRKYKKVSEKPPAELRPDLLDERSQAVIFLWLFAGFTMKKSYELVMHPKCSPQSLPPQVSNFFNSLDVKDFTQLIVRRFSENPYINPKGDSV